MDRINVILGIICAVMNGVTLTFPPSILQAPLSPHNLISTFFFVMGIYIAIHYSLMA